MRTTRLPRRWEDVWQRKQVQHKTTNANKREHLLVMPRIISVPIYLLPLSTVWIRTLITKSICWINFSDWKQYLVWARLLLNHSKKVTSDDRLISLSFSFYVPPSTLNFILDNQIILSLITFRFYYYFISWSIDSIKMCSLMRLSCGDRNVEKILEI